MNRLQGTRVSIVNLWTRLAGPFARYRYAVAALDQIALSVFNFALMIGLVRALSAPDFGIVSLWMTVSLFAFGVQNALVNTPLSVYLPSAPDEVAARHLEASLASVNFAALALTAVAILTVDMVVDADWAPQDVATAIAIPAFVIVGLYREYYRSIAFSRRDMGMLVLIDAPYLVVTTVCLLAMLVWPHYFASLLAAFAALSAGCLVSQLCVRRHLVRHRPRLFSSGWTRPYRGIAGEVSWSLVGVIATHLHARSYVYVAINLVGLAALAAINVVGVLFRPVHTLLSAWGRSALPHLASLYAAGRLAAFDRGVAQAFAGAAAASIVWTAMVWLAWPLIVRHFLAGKYPDAWLLVLPWAVAAGIACMEYTIGIALQAAREFKFLAYTTLLSAPVTAAATAGMIWWHDYTWAMYGVAFGNALALAMEAGRLCVVRRRLTATGPTPENRAMPNAFPLS